MTNLSTMIKLSKVQKEIDVPKRHNSPDGKYKYFKLGDIYKAIEPLKEKYNFTCYSSEDVLTVGNKIYVKSNVYFIDLEVAENNIVTASALARECTYNNGMAESQQTGSATTYARKNAYNALFCLEDEENIDPDTQANRPEVMLTEVERIPTKEEAATTKVAYLPNKTPRNKSLIDKPLGTLPKNILMKLASSVIVTKEVKRAAEIIIA